MSQPRVLFLGGAYSQVPIIKEAKSRGWYIITCDYVTDNPGHKYADEYHNVSTTDFEGVLNVAKQTAPDLIVAYASDPAAPTASWVSEQLGLPGNSYQSIQTLAEKDLFRAFLKENGFNTPQAVSIESDKVIELAKQLNFPIIVKPTDSSGSKGVSRVDTPADIDKAVEYALQFSRNKRIIAEEFIVSDGPQLHGDGFVLNGELIFSYLGDHHYNNKVNPFVPFSTSWPSKKEYNIINEVNGELKKAIKESGFEMGAVNIEVRVTKENKIYIMEIGPRSGGNFTPQAIKYGTGFDMVSAILDSFVNKPIALPDTPKLPSAYYALHTDIDGTLKDIIIKEDIKPYIREFHQYKQPGDKVNSFQGANAALGIVLLQFNTVEEMDYYIDNMDKYIEVKLEE